MLISNLPSLENTLASYESKTRIKVDVSASTLNENPVPVTSSPVLADDSVQISARAAEQPSALSPQVENKGQDVIAESAPSSEQEEDGAEPERISEQSDTGGESDQQPVAEQGAASASSQEESANQQESGRLSPREAELVQKLAARDAEVKAHERAHKSAGGQYTGAVSYSYQQGPDGRRYAVGGEVPIDVSPVSGSPQRTIEKMRAVRSAALAPAEPSVQDRIVASTATRLQIEAQQELAEQNRQEVSRQIESQSSSSDARTSAADIYENIVGLGSDKNDASDSIDELA